MGAERADRQDRRTSTVVERERTDDPDLRPPAGVRPTDAVLRLQQVVGNRTVTRLLASGAPEEKQYTPSTRRRRGTSRGPHIGGRAKQQALMAEQGKQGQGMAEGLVQ